MTETVKSCNLEPPSPRRLILNLIGVAPGGLLGVGDALRACALFGISENNVRVTLARLVQSALLEPAGRGVYRLGPERRKITEEIAGWRDVEERLTAWTGAWVAVSTGGLSRSDRKALRARERALSLLGMRELDPGLFIRPDNLAGGAAAVRERLPALGLAEPVAVFKIADLDPDWQARALGLWAAEGLADTYRQKTRRLEAWRAGAPALALDLAARESFLLGDDAVRQIVFDPLLPFPLGDADARHALIEAMKQFDEAGRRIWAQFLSATADGGPPATDADGQHS